MKDLGYKVIESQWKKLTSSDAKVKTLLQNFKFFKPIYGMIEPSLLSTIQNDKIFGMVLCDVKTPQHLKPILLNFAPFLKTLKLGEKTSVILWISLQTKSGNFYTT